MVQVPDKKHCFLPHQIPYGRVSFWGDISKQETQEKFIDSGAHTFPGAPGSGRPREMLRSARPGALSSATTRLHVQNTALGPLGSPLALRPQTPP